jgi:hypothetical protein
MHDPDHGDDAESCGDDHGGNAELHVLFEMPGEREEKNGEGKGDEQDIPDKPELMFQVGHKVRIQNAEGPVKKDGDKAGNADMS